MKIEFFVAGEPRPKQSFRIGGAGGFTPARVKAWQQLVAWAALCEMRAWGIREPLAGNVEVDLEFRLGDARRVDLDNLSKAVLDGCNKICWLDDNQVVHLHLHKMLDLSKPGVLVRIEIVEWNELAHSFISMASIAPVNEYVRS